MRLGMGLGLTHSRRASNIAPAPLAISGTPGLTADLDEAYVGFTVSATGGTAPYTFSVLSGALPDGITLDADTGEVSGTPTDSGPFAGIVIRVTDGVGATDDLDAFTLTVYGIKLVGMGEGAAANGGDVTLTLPAMVDGDTVYVFGGFPVGGTWPPTEPSGFAPVAETSGAGNKLGVWRKRMGASPDSEIVCPGGGQAADGVVYGFYALRGVDEATPEDATPTEINGSASQPDNPAITTQTNGAWVLALAASRSNVSLFTGPTDYGNKIDLGQNDTNDYSIGGATREIATAGAESPSAWSGWSTNQWRAITVAVRPAVP